MFWKIVFAVLAILAILWTTGFDFQGAKDAVTGPLFAYSDTWQLVINTGTTIVTFLMVFLIQNSQNRDGAAMQAKLDEILRAIKEARSEFIGIEHLTDEQIARIRTALEQEVGVCEEGKEATADDSVEQLLKRLR